MVSFEKTLPILSKRLLENVKRSEFITPEYLNRFSRKKYTFAAYDLVRKKVSSLNQQYEEFSGVKELKSAQEKVTVAGEKLEMLLQERRQAWGNLVEVQKKLKENYALLENTKRGDARYFDLIKNECDFLEEEKICEDKYNAIDKAERAQFNIFSTAVRNSHNIEKIQTEKRKYVSLVASLVGALIGMIATSVNHYLKMTELKLLIANLTAQDFAEQLEANSRNIENLSQAFSQFEKKNDSVNLNNLCKRIYDKLVSIENFFKIIENKGDIEVIQNYESVSHPSNQDSNNFKNKDLKMICSLCAGLIGIVGLVILGRIFS